MVVKKLFCVIGYIGEEVTAFCARSTSTSKCALGTVYACDRQVSTQFLAFYLKIISYDRIVIYAHMDIHKEARKNIDVLLYLYLLISLETGALGEASIHHFG